MDDVLTVEIDKALNCLVKGVFAEAFRIVSGQLFEHRGECTTVHQLEEDPNAILEVKCLVTSHN